MSRYKPKKSNLSEKLCQLWWLRIFKNPCLLSKKTGADRGLTEKGISIIVDEEIHNLILNNTLYLIFSYRIPLINGLMVYSTRPLEVCCFDIIWLSGLKILHFRIVKKLLNVQNNVQKSSLAWVPTVKRNLILSKEVSIWLIW